MVLIVDGGSAHKSKLTKKFVKSVGYQLEFVLLPPYSPDLNPDELVWSHIKNHTVGISTVVDKEDFKREVTKSMRSLQFNREKMRSFYQKRAFLALV